MVKRKGAPRRWLSAVALAVCAAFVSSAYAQQPGPIQAGVSIESVVSVGGGRYRITGKALDHQGNSACAMVLASGRCMFSCGPGSQTCEGGSSPLELGAFDLTGLPLEPDGSILVQIFIQGHVSHTEKRFPPLGQQAAWGVLNNVCCPTGNGVFSATIDGVAKQSELPVCGGDVKPSWEGYTRTTSGTREATGSYVSACGSNDYPLNLNLAPATCYVLFHDVAQEPFVTVLQTDCQAP